MGRDLSALFDPFSVAIVGASDDPAKYGHAVATQALRSGHSRPVHLVNRRGGTVLGRTAATSLSRHRRTRRPGRDLRARGRLRGRRRRGAGLRARAIVAITAGFAETGAAGLARQRAVAERVRAAGAVMVGPNCLGIADNTTELYLASDHFTPGRVALLSQSGNLALELQLRCATARSGLLALRLAGQPGRRHPRRPASPTAPAHEGTDAIAVYAEDFADGRAFAEAAAVGRASRWSCSPPGAARLGAQRPVPHRRADHLRRRRRRRLPRRGRRTGRHPARDDRRPRRPHRRPAPASGRRVAVFTDGGGHGVIAADAVEAAGLAVPELAPVAQATLGEALWEQSAVGNPVDLAGMGEQDPTSYAATVGALLAADEVDAVLHDRVLRRLRGRRDGLGGRERGHRRGRAGGRPDHRRTHGGRGPKPLVVQSMYPESPSCRILVAGRSPGLRGHRGRRPRPGRPGRPGASGHRAVVAPLPAAANR